MKVLFYGGVLDYTNGEQLYEAQNCSNIHELIDKLSEHYGERFNRFLLGAETCFFLLNGKGLMMTGGLFTKLQTGDKIEIIPHADAG